MCIFSQQEAKNSSSNSSSSCNCNSSSSNCNSNSSYCNSSSRNSTTINLLSSDDLPGPSRIFLTSLWKTQFNPSRNTGQVVLDQRPHCTETELDRRRLCQQWSSENTGENLLNYSKRNPPPPKKKLTTSFNPKRQNFDKELEPKSPSSWVTWP